MEKLLTRRNYILSSAAAATPLGITGCVSAEIAAEGLLSARSLLAFSQRAGEGVTFGWVGNYVYDRYKALTPNDAAKIADAARQSGGDQKLALQTAQDLGTEAVMDALSGKKPIWYQSNNTDIANVFRVEVTNLTESELRGRFDIGIFDDSNQLEVPIIKGRPYRLYPKSKAMGAPFVLNLSYKGVFPKPGNKTIKIVNNEFFENKGKMRTTRADVFVWGRSVQYA